MAKWIKRQAGLQHKKQVAAIAEWAAASPEFARKHVAIGANIATLSGVISPAAIRALVCEALLEVWLTAFSAGEKQGADLVVTCSPLAVDAWAGIDGFAEKMVGVGWLRVTGGGIVFPNFQEFAPGADDIERPTARPKPREMSETERADYVREQARLRQEKGRAAKKAALAAVGQAKTTLSAPPAPAPAPLDKTNLAAPAVPPSKPASHDDFAAVFQKNWNEYMPQAAHLFEPASLFESRKPASDMRTYFNEYRQLHDKPPATDEVLKGFFEAFFRTLSSGEFIRKSTAERGKPWVPAMCATKKHVFSVIDQISKASKEKGPAK